MRSLHALPCHGHATQPQPHGAPTWEDSSPNAASNAYVCPVRLSALPAGGFRCTLVPSSSSCSASVDSVVSVPVMGRTRTTTRTLRPCELFLEVLVDVAIVSVLPAPVGLGCCDLVLHPTHRKGRVGKLPAVVPVMDVLNMCCYVFARCPSADEMRAGQQGDGFFPLEARCGTAVDLRRIPATRKKYTK